MRISDFTPSGALLGLLRSALPYLLAAGLGFGGAWWIQGLRITAGQQEFEQYKLDQQAKTIQREAAAAAQRENAGKEYREKESKLKNQIATGEVWRRCVAAGRCGRLPDRPASAATGVSPAGGVDGASANPVSSGTGGSAQVVPVVNDCAQTTLQLNLLQLDIERQAGY